ncbi:basic blue protein [Canna indica]|uniref:Plantacyanin n=1 Tax=Canna indica TaxID=4628 RepID=A0AAQ3QBG4_9LILI|nr:basic blue protein [Canna indica]
MGEQGRGSARIVGAALLVCLLLHCETAAAAVYTVGDSKGWTFNTVGWPRGKRFRAGDVLVFKYSPSAHNVVAVNGPGYRGCTTPRGSRVYKSGNDRITLRKGKNFFICNFVGHCQAGMKIGVTAA